MSRGNSNTVVVTVNLLYIFFASAYLRHLASLSTHHPPKMSGAEFGAIEVAKDHQDLCHIGG